MTTPAPLEILFADGSFLKLTHNLGGAVALEARGSLGPTVTALDIPLGEVENLRRWLGKHDASRRAGEAKGG